MNDQFAVGPTRLMRAFAAVFPDASEFMRLAPLWRIDATSFASERLLATHLHHRGVRFGHIEIAAAKYCTYFSRGCWRNPRVAIRTFEW